mmetsp:Transcript_43411/g.112075  ORF Transcript_43411/g.112075 Transcript_43411/m.112075 type:complete len:299 (-) Transcript_43411:545-1441(-)
MSPAISSSVAWRRGGAAWATSLAPGGDAEVAAVWLNTKFIGCIRREIACMPTSCIVPASGTAGADMERTDASKPSGAAIRYWTPAGDCGGAANTGTAVVGVCCGACRTTGSVDAGAAWVQANGAVNVLGASTWSPGRRSAGMLPVDSIDSWDAKYSPDCGESGPPVPAAAGLASGTITWTAIGLPSSELIGMGLSALRIRAGCGGSAPSSGTDSPEPDDLVDFVFHEVTACCCSCGSPAGAGSVMEPLGGGEVEVAVALGRAMRRLRPSYKAAPGRHPRAVPVSCRSACLCAFFSSSV